MKRSTRLPFLVVLLSVLGGCASAPEPQPATDGGKLALRDGAVLDGQDCGVESPTCPEGLTCASLDLDTGRKALCVDTRAVCDRLQCGRGECVVLESYPVQIRCAP
ncbi:hypothetical protein HPC49_39865 [Pyxidicoccus fallax]|uniref:Lipoprotein n=1 Tax=Pyxidicoccus fallax TaxID=394095 RepID=A0A848LRF8_9BACT|nr:hypothetical protein [Pyxidicoccus fallax]NMO20220.1 hypothetical protein [Pyxidicoccus fallax]NPC84356.1 hypothetical protein [Pyxidicoccus fallax]